jgi:hypothetical protein
MEQEAHTLRLEKESSETQLAQLATDNADIDIRFKVAREEAEGLRAHREA